MRALYIFLLLSALLVGPAFGQVKTRAQTTWARAALLRLENDWLKAIAQHNILALNRILAAEFIDTTYTGELRNKDHALARAKSGTTAIRSQQLQDMQVSFYRNVAVVTGLNVVVGDQFGEARIRFTDVFVKRDGRWQAVAAQETLIRKEN